MAHKGIAPLSFKLNVLHSLAGLIPAARLRGRVPLALICLCAAFTALSPYARAQDTDGLVIIQGTPQTGATTRSLPQLFSVQTQGNETAGIAIIFTAPSSGASGTFPNGTNTITVNTDSNGYAVPPLLVANSTPGAFTVTASDPTGGVVDFSITTNACVTSPVVSTDSSDSTVSGSLPYEVANACAGSTITFASSVSGETISLANRLRIDDNLTIQGPGASSLAVDGGSATRLFYIGGGNVVMSGLTLQHGLGLGGAHACGGGAAGMGGAIFQNNGTVTLNDVTLSHNEAEGGGSSAISGTFFSNGSGGAGFGGPPTSDTGASGGDLGGLGGLPGQAAGIFGDGAGGGGFIGSSGTPKTLGGGAGGFGGGGGGGFGLAGGNGGFGAGGGSGSTAGLGGWGSGSGASSSGGTGGGGAGFGGAVFMRNGTLALYGDTFSGNSAVGGTGTISGQGKGGSLFLFDNTTSAGAGTNVAVDFGSTYMTDVAAQAGTAAIGMTDPTYSNYVLGGTCPSQDTVDICGTLNEGTISATAGTPQTVPINTALSTLTATVQLPSTVSTTFLDNVPITFTTPTSGASATFSGGATTATVLTNSSGEATAPALTANGTVGTYTVTASIGSLAAQFSITNSGIPTIGLSTTSLSFGSQTQGTTSASMDVTLSNSGTVALSITSIAISGNFTETNNCGSSLASSTSCQIMVTFTPESVGALSGALTITDDSSTGSTQIITLSGTGTSATSFTITPIPSTETIKRGVLGAFILTLKSVNGFAGSVALSCSGGPPGSYCADLPATVYLNGTAYAISGILFPKTAAAGTYTITFTGVSSLFTDQATATFIVK